MEKEITPHRARLDGTVQRHLERLRTEIDGAVL